MDGSLPQALLLLFPDLYFCNMKTHFTGALLNLIVNVLLLLVSGIHSTSATRTPASIPDVIVVFSSQFMSIGGVVSSK